MSLVSLIANGSILVGLSTAVAMAQPSQSLPRDVELKCTTTEVVPTQPCGGSNSRTIAVEIDNGVVPSSGYKEDVNYGGCYPISSSGFGKVTGQVVDGDVLSFNLTPVGYFGPDGTVPIFLDSSDEAVIPARLNLKTSVLQLDTSKVWWPYRKPSTLNCVPLF